MSAPTAPPRPTPPDPAPFVPPVPVTRSRDGLRLVAMDVPDGGLVDIRLLWPRGWAHEPGEQAGVTELAGRLVGTATVVRDAYELARDAESVGATVRAAGSAESFMAHAEVVRTHVEPALDLLLDAVARPDLSPDRVDRVRDEAIDERRRHLADPARLANELLAGRIHAGTRAAGPSTGSVPALRARTVDDVSAHVRRTLHTQRPTVLVIGDLAALDLPAIAARVADALPDATAADAPSRSPAEVHPTPEVVLVDRPGSVQSVLAIGHQAPSRHHADHTALQLGMGLLGGAFHSRLNLRLREERGFTYGARAKHQARRDTGAVVMRTAVDAATTTPALHDIDNVLSGLLADGPTHDELDDIRDSLLRRAPQRYETVRRTADAVTATLSLGLAPHEVGAFEADLPNVTLDDVDGALRRHLRPGELTAVIVGDAGRVRDELDHHDARPVTVIRDLPD